MTRTPKGGALISALIAVIVISAMALGLTSITMTSNGAVMDTQDRYQALLLAETGMSIVYKTVDFMPDTVPEFSGTNLEDLTTNLSSGVLYQKQLDNNREIVVVKRKTATGEVMLEATGKVEKKLILGNVTRVYRTVQAVCKTSTEEGGFLAGAFGLDGLSVNGNFASDSYDSTAGYYNPAAPGHHGDIGTNKTIGKGQSASLYIDGDVWVGPGQALWDGTGNVSGTVKNLPSPVAVAIGSYNPPTGALTALPNGNNKDLSNGENYHLTSLSENNGTITASGTVNIWVDGSIDLKCAIKLANATSKLNIWQGPGASTITINGGGALNTSTMIEYPAVTVPAGTIIENAIVRTINKGSGGTYSCSNANQLPQFYLIGGPANGETVTTIMQGNQTIGWTMTTPAQSTLQQAYIVPAHMDANQGVPSNFSIVSQTTGLVKLNGHSNFFGTILAPYAPVTIKGTADVFGAALGKTVDLNGTGDFHSDTKAKSPGFVSKPVIASYVEVPSVVPMSD
jgi:hypothetical protein